MTSVKDNGVVEYDHVDDPEQQARLGSTAPPVEGNGNGTSNNEKSVTPERADGKIELKEGDCYDKLGFGFPSWKKWAILSVIFLVQVSMNLNASLYGNANDLLANQFGISKQAARVGQMIFLIAYAFGCELWAPWSEELGRRWVLQASLFLVNIWQIPCALAPNFGTIVVARFLGGLSSAGGSVTLGMFNQYRSLLLQQLTVDCPLIRHGGRHVGLGRTAVCRGLHCAFLRGWVGRRSYHWRLHPGISRLAVELLDPTHRRCLRPSPSLDHRAGDACNHYD
jgi:hypothetical protein